ncbi:heterokaryon incompatibility protein-domain-containing protein [Pisolithus marmoratus]|nr:heterokaryon incompatibility protein-domain-containing protein [Pisolithus marmoratus]
MRLIDIVAMLNVEASTNEGKMIPRTTKVLEEFYGPDLAEKEYAILSHCWGIKKEGEQEVLFEDMKQLLIASDDERKEIRGRTGYKKIIATCRQAQKDGLEWVWIDTCCINKESSAELSEAINSMYKWYASAKLCYAYLHDVVGSFWKVREESKVTPKWFSRGWTLQELIAPKVVRFFDQKWECIGDKSKLAWFLSIITRIPGKVLTEGLEEAMSSVGDTKRPSVAQIMSWAADRITTREEDRAYSLLGLLGVHIPMLYGEGKNAFHRLQLEIIRTSNDQSIFAWGLERQFGWSSSILADDPNCFRDCGVVSALKPERFTGLLRIQGMPDDELTKSTQNRLRTFTVTNDGIHIWLPTATFGPLCQVTLPLKTHLVFRGSTRIFGIPKYPGKMEFKEHFLPYKDARYPSPFTFELQDQTLSHDGFIRDRVLPDGAEVNDDSVTLSSDIDFAAIGYFRRRDDTRFLVLLSYFSGVQPFALAILSPNDFKEVASLRVWALERLLIPNHVLSTNKHLIQHVHFPRSIQGARVIVIHRMLYHSPVGCTVKIDIAQCSGCCTYEERPTSHLVETRYIPDLMWNCLRGKLPQTCHLSRDYAGIPFSLFDSELKFKPEGNIIEFATALGLDPIEVDIRSIHRPKSGVVEASLTLAHPKHPILHYVALYDATSCSLPANRQVLSLLDALSSRLSGRLLVTTAIHCSDCRHCVPTLDSTSTRRSGLDLDSWQTLGVSTPLCSVMMPLPWRQIDSDAELMTMLLKIIDSFSVLVGWADKPDAPKRLRESATVEAAIQFFVDIFGGGDIRNFIGDIAFFNDLPQIMETENYTQPGTEVDKVTQHKIYLEAEK